MDQPCRPPAGSYAAANPLPSSSKLAANIVHPSCGLTPYKNPPPSFELPPDYNIAPSTYQPVIQADAETGERALIKMRWGLIPAKVVDPDGFKIYTTSNAQAETDARPSNRPIA